MSEIKVTHSDWLFKMVEGRSVLTLHRDYFRLRKPLERRIYELARKHCGAQEKWRSEERRGGKERVSSCRSWCWPDHLTTHTQSKMTKQSTRTQRQIRQM